MLSNSCVHSKTEARRGVLTIIIILLRRFDFAKVNERSISYPIFLLKKTTDSGGQSFSGVVDFLLAMVSRSILTST